MYVDNPTVWGQRNDDHENKEHVVAVDIAIKAGETYSLGRQFNTTIT